MSDREYKKAIKRLRKSESPAAREIVEKLVGPEPPRKQGCSVLFGLGLLLVAGYAVAVVV